MANPTLNPPLVAPARFQTRARSPRHALTLVGAIIVAACLRWACIHQSLFGDELFLYSEVHLRSLGQMLSLVHTMENTPPLFFLLAWVLAKGRSAMLLVRVPSLIASVAIVPLIYVLGRRVVGGCAALVAAAWFALSPFQIFYGTEDRAYATVAALVLVSTIALLIALERDRELRWWVVYAVAAIAAIYTHYIAALVLVPQAAWALWTHRELARRQIVWHGLVVVALLPWIPWFLAQARHSAHESVRLSSLSPLTPGNAAKTELQSLLGHPYVSPGVVPGLAPLLVLAVLFGGVLVTLGYQLWREPARSGRAMRGTGSLIVLLAIFPIAAIVVYSLRPHTSLLLPRNVEVGVPYALLVIGWLLTRWQPRTSLALSLVALAALAAGSVKMLSPNYQRPDGAAAARFIDARAPAGAPVIDFPGPQGTEFYFRRVHPVLTPAQFGTSGWSAAAARHLPVFVSLLHRGGCGRVAPHYRLLVERVWPSIPLALTVCEYVPAG